MFGGKKLLHRRFARLSPVFAALGCGLILASATPAKTNAETTTTAAAKRQSASTQYARAEEQRAALNSRPSEKRTLADYKLVVTGYRRVAMITPRAPEVPDSLLAIAELYPEMGDRFGRSYSQPAADSYQFLVHEYPTSKYCQDAILRVAKLQREQLGSEALSAFAEETGSTGSAGGAGAAAEQRCAGCGEQCGCKYERGATKHRRAANERAGTRGRQVRQQQRVPRHSTGAADSRGDERRRDADNHRS